MRVTPMIAAGMVYAALAGAQGAAPGGTIRSGSEVDYPPFCIVHEDGRADGFSVELLRAALAKMGREVTFRTGPWDEVRGWLERGEIDALPLVGRTPEREALFDFTVPYLTMHGAIVVREETTDVNTLDDLHGRRVGVMKGDNAEEFLRREDRDFEIVSLPTFTEALHALNEGRCDAVVVQRLVAIRLLAETGLDRLRIVARPIHDFSQAFCFAAKAGDRETLAILNEGLALAVADGTHRRLHAKWFAALELPSNRPIVIGGDHNYPPFEFLDEKGRPAGYNVDLIRAIADATGLDIRIRLGEWTATMSGLEHGEIDAIMGMLYSSERDETFDFSQAHLVNHGVAVTRKEDGPPPSSLTDLSGKRIVVQDGDIMHEFYRLNGLTNRLAIVGSQEQALRELAAGKHDCALVARVAAYYWIERKGWDRLAVGRTPFVSPDYGFAVPKGQRALLAQLSEGLTAIAHSGDYKRIQEKWMGVYEEQTNWRNALNVLAWVAGLLLLIALLALLWSWGLRKQVARRTAELQEKESLLSRSQEIAHTGSWTLDLATNRLSWSDEVYRIFGCKPQAFAPTYEAFLDFTHPEDRAAVDEAYSRSAREGNDGYEIEHRIVRRNADEVRYVHERCVHESDASGAIVQSTGMVQDITERKRAEEALRESEENLRITLNSIGDAVITTDVDGRVVSMNPVAETLTGWARNEAVGQPLDDVFKIINEQTRRTVESPVENVLKSGQIVGLANHTLLIAKDGQETPIADSGAPIKNAAGETTGVVLVFRDQTDERDARRAIEKSQQRLESMFRVAPVGIGLVRERVIMEANERLCQMTGYSAEELIGQNARMLYPSQHEYERVGVEKYRQIEENGTGSVETEWQCKDGSRINVLLSSTPLDPADYLKGVTFTALDITERTQAGERLERNNQLQRSVINVLNFHIIDLQVFLDEALNEAIRLTDSKIGYIYFYDENEQQFILNSWSKDVMRECSVVNPQTCNELDKTGIWGEAVRQRKPILLNNFRAAHPQKKGLPKGHVSLDRFLTVPIFENERIVAVVGVANKPSDYHEQDVLTLQLFMDSVWKSAKDIKSQQALKESEEMMRNSQSVAHICSYSTNLNGNEIEKSQWVCSPEFYKLFGIDETYPHTIAGWANFIHPDFRDEVVAYHEKVVNEKTFFNKEYKIIRINDGEERWVHGTGELEFDKKGIPVRMHGAIQDITERTQAEKELRRLSAAIEQSPETVLITDTAGTIQYVNPAFEAVTGYSRDEAMGQNPRILKSGRQDAGFYTAMWSTLLDGRVWTGLMVNKRKDGSLYTEDASIAPVKDSNGTITNYVGVKRDITAELEREDMLRQAQKMESVGRLAGGVAHDFNNLLMGIMGYADLCREELPEKHPVREWLDEITREAQRSANLTRQLLAFARKQTVAPQVVDLNDAVGNMLKMLRRLIGEDIDLSWQPGAAPWSVKIDPGQVDQILANLCINARDAIGSAGKVTIETENMSIGADYCKEHIEAAPGSYVMLAVSDDGCGMDHETLGKVFEPFFTTKPTGEGTGLGLATVYGIVKQNNGFVNVYSEPGKGTTFRMYLPRDTSERKAATEAETTTASQGGTETILLVEDETAIRFTMRLFLERFGYTVIAAESPAAALRLAAEHPDRIDLLLTDVVMPGMSGRELAEKLAVDFPSLKILYMSGYTANVIAHRGILDDGVQFISKPIGRDALAQKVREVLG